MWLPAPPQRRQLARDALGEVLDDWLHAGKAYLTHEGGWPLGPPATSSEGWSAILYALADAAAMVGRYSQVTRTVTPVEQEQLAPLARLAFTRIARLAAAVLIELGGAIDRGAVLTEAAAFLQEVDEEDDGVMHAGDALGSLLQASLDCVARRRAREGCGGDSRPAGGAGRVPALAIARRSGERRRASSDV